jgi:5'-nucleotidase / UDP-sugar diphosphatase
MHPTRAVPWRTSRAMIALLAICAMLLAVLPATSATAQDEEEETGPRVERIAGADRVGTAIAVSAQTFDTAATVVIARADEYADALAGAPLATFLGAPLLLTSRDGLLPAVQAELERLGSTHAVLLGGTAALSETVEQDLNAMGVTPRRVSGPNRFATAAAVAANLVGEDTGGTVFVVKGIDDDPGRGWPDAVSAAPYAAFLNAPVLLVATDDATQPTLDAIAELDPAEVIIVGGTAAVSAATEESLGSEDEDTERTVRRLSGDTRYTTSGAVYDEAIAVGMDPTSRWLATGRNWPDTLAAGPAVATLGASLLLVDPEALANSPSTRERIRVLPDVLDEVVLVGGTAAISDAVRDELAAAIATDVVDADFCLTILHNNDGESKLLNAGRGFEDFGGVSRFATLIDREKARAIADRDDGCTERGVLTVTSGDNFLAGPEFQASLDKGEPYYDAIAQDRFDYDALAIGNHDFDFGPEVTAAFIRGFTGDAVFLSANLDFSGEPELQDLVDAGRIAASTMVEVGSRSVGVIGAVTPILRSISSPRNVVIDPDVAGAIAEEVETLQAADADIIVLISHLQSIEEDLVLLAELDGIDVAVAGGGDEVLGQAGTLYVPGDESVVAGTYPMYVDDAEGTSVPVVTTAGDYRYLGRLVTRFGEDNTLLDGDDAVDDRYSRMVRVADAALPDGITRDPELVTAVDEPISDYVAGLAANIIGESAVELDGSRQNIRTTETNLGNLMADSLRASVVDRGEEFGVDVTNVVALQNGGGIRAGIPAGDLSELDTFSVAPFANFTAAVEDVTATELKLLLENGYSRVEFVDGRFAHISGMHVEVDLDATAQERTTEGELTEEGERVVTVTLVADDGTETPLVVEGVPVPGAPTVTVATIDFLALGGDQYPFPDRDFTVVGVSYQQGLRNQIASFPDGVLPTAAGDPYAAGGEGRITFLP